MSTVSLFAQLVTEVVELLPKIDGDGVSLPRCMEGGKLAALIRALIDEAKQLGFIWSELVRRSGRNRGGTLLDTDIALAGILIHADVQTDAELRRELTYRSGDLVVRSHQGILRDGLPRLSAWAKSRCDSQRNGGPKTAIGGTGYSATSSMTSATSNPFETSKRDTPSLSEKGYQILEEMKRLGALSADTRQTGPNIAVSCDTKTADVDTFKRLLSDLKKLGLVDSKTGRGGGSWLTPEGLLVANNLLANRTASAEKR
jgi:hypothetical protein